MPNQNKDARKIIKVFKFIENVDEDEVILETVNEDEVTVIEEDVISHNDNIVEGLSDDTIPTIIKDNELDEVISQNVNIVEGLLDDTIPTIIKDNELDEVISQNVNIVKGLLDDTILPIIKCNEMDEAGEFSILDSVDKDDTVSTTSSISDHELTPNTSGYATSISRCDSVESCESCEIVFMK